MADGGVSWHLPNHHSRPVKNPEISSWVFAVLLLWSQSRSYCPKPRHPEQIFFHFRLLAEWPDHDPDSSLPGREGGIAKNWLKSPYKRSIYGPKKAPLNWSKWRAKRPIKWSIWGLRNRDHTSYPPPSSPELFFFLIQKQHNNNINIMVRGGGRNSSNSK